MDDMFLIYVGSAGEVDGVEICEFYFSRTPESAIGDGWEMGARDNVEPPDAEFVHQKFRLDTPCPPLRLLEAEYERCYLDGVFGVLALCWEHVEYSELSPGQLDALATGMLRFFYGAPLPQVLQQLAARGYALRVVAVNENIQEDTSLDAAFPDTDNLF